MSHAAAVSQRVVAARRTFVRLAVIFGLLVAFGLASGKLGGGMLGLADKAKSFLAKGCGCFTEETPVWTQRGLIPIAQVRVGDEVLARDAGTGEVVYRPVTAVFVRDGAPLVRVSLTSDDGTQTDTFQTAEEHPFLVERLLPCPGTEWVRADGLRVGDAVATLTGRATVAGLAFTSERARVHNLEVEGLHNYAVGHDGVVVHNNPCKLWLQRLQDAGARVKNTEAWYDEVVKHLTKHHGGDAYKLSDAIHAFKKGRTRGRGERVSGFDRQCVSP